MNDEVKLIKELREVAQDHAHGEGYLHGLLRRGAAAIDALCTKVAEVRAENEALVAGLLDPESVLVNMLRGNIAKLSPRGVCKVYGQVLNGEDAHHVEIARLRAELEAARGLLAKAQLHLQASGHNLAADDIGRHLAETATPVPEVRQAEQGERQEAVAYLHTLHTERAQRHSVVSQSEHHPFGVRGENYDEAYSVTTTPLYTTHQPGQDVRSLLSADDVRDACANAVSVFAEEANADQCREVAEYMREVLLAQIARRQAQRQ